MARRFLIAGNWKMNGLIKDGCALASAVVERHKAVNNAVYDMLICPPFPLISSIVKICTDSGVLVGGQDCHMNENGAHTGDTSAIMLKDIGCRYVIVGHSERRTDHAETDSIVKAKAKAALASGLKVIICIGETLIERETGQTLTVNKRQLNGSLPSNITAENTIIAYEPVWAIGTGKVATPEQAQEVHAAIRAELAHIADADIANDMRILYGGSMKRGNASELLGQPDIDGGLIGGASLKPEDFFGIADVCHSIP